MLRQVNPSAKSLANEIEGAEFGVLRLGATFTRRALAGRARVLLVEDFHETTKQIAPRRQAASVESCAKAQHSKLSAPNFFCPLEVFAANSPPTKSTC
jgi:hypothetical protein